MVTPEIPPAWTPENNMDNKAKEAFDQLDQATNKVLIPTDGPKNRFILQSKGYFDLQAYVLSGKTLPHTDGEFEAKITQKAFKKLTDIDTQIYDKTKKCMVEIGAACHDFHEHHLQRLITASAAAVNYSASTLELLDEAEDVNLKHHLNIILDEKYASAKDQDSDYQEAKEAAKMTLGMLKDEATTKKKEVDSIVEVLQRFKEKTIDQLDQVKYLQKQYETGPVVNSSGKTTPYLQYLNADLAEQKRQMEQAIKDANDKHSDWLTATGTAIGTAFIPCVGFIIMAVHAVKASKLRDAWEKLVEQTDKYKRDNAEEELLINNVSIMISQFDDLDDKMATAITAMSELSLLFASQSECYDKIAFYLNNMSSSISLGAIKSRKSYINNALNNAIKKLRELKEVAEEFNRSILNQTTLDLSKL